MRFGVVILPDECWPAARKRWVAAEALGFDHAWTYDHLTWRSLRDATWFGAVPTLVAAAATTTRIRLGTLVASPNFRHPVPFAKELMSLDDISGGRLSVGLGAGGTGFDATALGQDPWSSQERADRFEEFVTLLDRLLTQRATSYEGRFYSAREARAVPGCVQVPRPPFAVAAEGPRGMRLAAALGETWVMIDGRGVARQRIACMMDACTAAGREPGTLGRLVLLGFRERPLASVDAFRDCAGRYSEMGFTDLVVHWPRPGEPFAEKRRVLERIAAEVMTPSGGSDRGTMGAGVAPRGECRSSVVSSDSRRRRLAGPEGWVKTPATRPRRRGRWLATAAAALAALALAVLCAVPAASAAFGLEDVVRRAEALARRPYQDARGAVPDWLVEISYDQWRDIRFRPEHALWRGSRSPFEIQLFHPGVFYDRSVAIHEVDAQGVRRVPFSPSHFDYGQNDFASRVPQDLGYAGFRVHHPIKGADYKDEVVVFLGASYFRAVGRDLAYGLSARGVAIDTALPSGEEFPGFREFWLLRPSSEAREIELYALLDSPRATGAYRFVVTPGERTVVDVEGRLYLREPVGKLGLAPLTSMFLFGENTLQRPEDFRPEVHDSDGLLLVDGTGEWIWRPLDNPRTLRVTSFRLRDPKGFGLIQRDRDFGHYQDLETRQETRPSAWVEPRGAWGPGRVELVEIPTPQDIHDNMVAFWVSENTPPPREALPFAYRLSWYGDDPARPPGGRVVATRRDRGTHEDAHRFVIDFEGGNLAALPPETVLRAVVSAASPGGKRGELIEQVVAHNPVTNGWRLTLQVRAPGGDPLELRAFLQHGDDTLTETWSYLLTP